MTADAVDLVHQVPCPLVGHVHRAARCRDRAEVADMLQELDLARPDPLLRIEIDAKAQMRKRSGTRLWHGQICAPAAGRRLPPKAFANKIEAGRRRDRPIAPSLHRYASELHHLAPFLSLVRERLAELRGCHRLW